MSRTRARTQVTALLSWIMSLSPCAHGVSPLLSPNRGFDMDKAAILAKMSYPRLSCSICAQFDYYPI